jgi:hypothetical protein
VQRVGHLVANWAAYLVVRSVETTVVSSADKMVSSLVGWTVVNLAVLKAASKVERTAESKAVYWASSWAAN